MVFTVQGSWRWRKQQSSSERCASSPPMWSNLRWDMRSRHRVRCALNVFTSTASKRIASMARRPAALLGSRGIAFSTNVSDSREPDFATLEAYVVRVFKLLLPINTLSLVNVNLPEKPKGIRWTRQSVRHYDGKVVPDKDPAGRPIFWFTVTPLEGAAEGTDRWAVEHGWVSITPLRLDLTDEADLARALALSDTPALKVSKNRPGTNPSRKK